MATKRLTGSGVYSVNNDAEMNHVLGGMERDGVRFHYITQNGEQFKMYKLFISEILHLMFLDCS